MTDYAFDADTHATQTARLGTALLRDLGKRSLFPWLADAAMDWLVIGIALAAISLWPHFYTVVFGVLIIGNRQHALAILGHDGTHYTLSRNAALNDFLTNLLCFWPLGLTVSGYRALHYAHHKDTGTEHDPELGHKRMRAPQWDLPATPRTVLRYAILDLIGYSLADYTIIVRFSKPQSKREYLPLALFHIAALSLLLGLGCWLAASVWYFSLVTGFMMFFRLRLWLEHQGTDDTQRLALTWWQGALLSPHNAWHHWEHHKYPTIPYHKLPQARQRLTGPAILTLHGLVASFASAGPIPSGTALKVTPTTGTPLPAERKPPVPRNEPDGRRMSGALRR
jgi:fatty acid desaturase